MAAPILTKDMAATAPAEPATPVTPTTPGTPSASETAKQKKQRKKKEKKRAAKERARREAGLEALADTSPAEGSSAEDVPGPADPTQETKEKKKGAKQAEKEPFSPVGGEFTFGVGQGFEFDSKFGTEPTPPTLFPGLGAAGSGDGGHGTDSPQVTATQPAGQPEVINLTKAEAQRLFSELQRQITLSNTALEESRKLWAADRAGSHRQLDQLKARCDSLEQSNAAMTEANKELTQWREQVRILQDKLRTVTASAKVEAAKRDAEIEELRERILSQETELGELRSRERERQASEDAVAKVKRDAEDMTQRLKVALEEQIRVLEEENDGQKEVIAQKEQELDEQQHKITASAVEKAELVRERGLDEQEKVDLRNEIAEALSVVSRHEKTIVRLKDELADLRVEMGSAQLQLSDNATTIQDLRNMASGLQRRIDRESELGETGSSGAQTQKEQGLIEEIERLNKQLESQELELESIKSFGFGLDEGEGKEDESAKKATDLVGDDGSLPLSSLLGGQDFKGFLDKFNASGNRRLGRPTASVTTSSSLGGKLHLSDEELVRQYNRDHPEAIFQSAEDAARFGDLAETTSVDAAWKMALHDLMTEQSGTIKRLYEMAKAAGKQVVTREIVVEREVPADKYLPSWLHPTKLLARFRHSLFADPRTVTQTPAIAGGEAKEATAVKDTDKVLTGAEPTVSTAVAPSISSVFLVFFLMAVAFCFFATVQMNARSNSTNKQALRPWERCHLPYPWRLLMYMNGGTAPQWAQALRRWVVLRYDERIPPF
ncbi:hypothetical protein GP486_007264 [Trichoglossum hirsutum]|uniref:Uncharacterized protein n=1 Tax=Trichoglossum hirsutum TaxID=265104 RepID=A0A9P8L6Y7_9PEZI|nr:hypothetical protein GP486_007264 [Trichoglossum hirsutum]